MSNRALLARNFLERAEWAQATATPVAGDASNRSYARLTRDDGATAILMDAPPETGEDVRPFIAVDRYLVGLGLSAPEIYAEEIETGFLLLEDLGDALFARVLSETPNRETEIYEAATDALLELHRHAPPDWLRPYDTPLMTDMAALAYRFYVTGIAGVPDEPAEARFRAGFAPVLDRYVTGPQVLVQRDYHAENLLWLPRRRGVARVGMIDFQDATSGHISYDLLSLLQDARRDVPVETERAMVTRYVDRSGSDRTGFDAAYHVLGVQRNMRILGVFARLCLFQGKSHYVDMIPRVWGYLSRDLDHPALADIADMIRDHLPPPTPAALQTLKDQCAIRPIP